MDVLNWIGEHPLLAVVLILILLGGVSSLIADIARIITESEEE